MTLGLDKESQTFHKTESITAEISSTKIFSSSQWAYVFHTKYTNNGFIYSSE